MVITRSGKKHPVFEEAGMHAVDGESHEGRRWRSDQRSRAAAAPSTPLPIAADDHDRGAVLEKQAATSAPRLDVPPVTRSISWKASESSARHHDPGFHSASLLPGFSSTIPVGARALEIASLVLRLSQGRPY